MGSEIPKQLMQHFVKPLEFNLKVCTLITY